MYFRYFRLLCRLDVERDVIKAKKLREEAKRVVVVAISGIKTYSGFKFCSTWSNFIYSSGAISLFLIIKMSKWNIVYSCIHL